MNSVIKASVGLAVIIAVFSLILSFSGLHASNPMIAQFAFIIPAIVINFGCVFWCLKQTAAENGYLKQLLNALLLGLLAGLLIFGFSYLMLTVLRPDYLAEVKTATIEWLEGSGAPPQVVETQVAQIEQTTPLSQALGGWIGTFATSLVLGAIIAIFQRRK